MNIWGMSQTGIGNSECIDPGAVECLVSVRTSKNLNEREEKER